MLEWSRNFQSPVSESRGGRPGLPDPNSHCLCERKATLNLNWSGVLPCSLVFNFSGMGQQNSLEARNAHYTSKETTVGLFWSYHAHGLHLLGTNNDRVIREQRPALIINSCG